MSIIELQREIEDTAREFKFIRNVVKVDVTDFSVKYRLMIDEDLYIQIYTNIRNGTTGLTLVLHGQRIYGRDSEDFCLEFYLEVKFKTKIGNGTDTIRRSRW